MMKDLKILHKHESQGILYCEVEADFSGSNKKFTVLISESSISVYIVRHSKAIKYVEFRGDTIASNLKKLKCNPYLVSVYANVDDFNWVSYSKINFIEAITKEISKNSKVDFDTVHYFVESFLRQELKNFSIDLKTLKNSLQSLYTRSIELFSILHPLDANIPKQIDEVYSSEFSLDYIYSLEILEQILETYEKD